VPAVAFFEDFEKVMASGGGAHLAHRGSLCWHPVSFASQRSGPESAGRGTNPGEIIPE